MEYECQLRKIETQPVMSIRGQASVETLAAVIGEFCSEVWRYIEHNGGGVAGPPFTRYHGLEGGVIDIEAGIPVQNPLPARGRIQPRELPGGDAVVTVHFGPYEQLPAAGAALQAWAQANGRQAAGPNWELYWTDPQEIRDPQQWKTEVFKPLV